MGQRRNYIVTLTSEERDALTRLVNTGQAKAYQIKHAHILLTSDENGPNETDQAIAKWLHCHANTVVCVRRRFVEQGMDAALERKKRQTPPVPRKLDGRAEAQLIALACRKPPAGQARWAMWMLADEMVEMGIVDHLSRETVRRVLKKTNSSRTCKSVG